MIALIGVRAVFHSLKVICADFLAGANLDNDDSTALLQSISRFFQFLPGEQRRAFLVADLRFAPAPLNRGKPTAWNDPVGQIFFVTTSCGVRLAFVFDCQFFSSVISTNSGKPARGLAPSDRPSVDLFPTKVDNVQSPCTGRRCFVGVPT